MTPSGVGILLSSFHNFGTHTHVHRMKCQRHGSLESSHGLFWQNKMFKLKRSIYNMTVTFKEIKNYCSLSEHAQKLRKNINAASKLFYTTFLLIIKVLRQFLPSNLGDFHPASRTFLNSTRKKGLCRNRVKSLLSMRKQLLGNSFKPSLEVSADAILILVLKARF